MKYITEDELLDIDDFILEKYDSLKDKPQILFQTITQDVLAKKSIQEIIKADNETFRDMLFKTIKEKKS